ncbi:MAG TPA: DUF3108 domain-containing protein [Methylotenera sp.]|nr:DUF3108 domain-containing protein [Methylotenera sp.]HPV44803.1 DUF3108 domain-containing protein [Methylotenera sp.]
MWSKLEQVLNDPSHKRLGLALAVSVVLHFFLLGKLDLTLPDLKKEMHLIEASIQMPKAVVKTVETPIPEDVVIPEPTPPVKPPEPVEPPEAEMPNQVNEAAVTDAAPDPEPVTENPPQPQTESSEPDPPQEEPQLGDAGLVINENAYQYVETDFDVRTRIDGSTEGKAKITYNLIDNKQYQLKWLTEGSGIVALLFPDLLQTSEGELTKAGLQPKSYLYQFGNKTDKTRTANFDWQTRKVILQTSKGAKTEDLSEGTQDILSFMYQFMYVAPLQTMQIHIATGKKLATYDYSFEGEENINSVLGELKTIHITHSNSDADEKTELWLAIDYQFVPVKIRKTEKNGDVVEMVATRINTNRPTVNN